MRATLHSPPSPGAAPAPPSVLQSVNWRDYRDHLSTADREGRRVWLFPRKPRGRFTSARAWVSAFLLILLFAGPFIRIDGNPLLMMNVVSRKFVILGQVFWPQDFPLFALAMLIFLTGIGVFTAAFGRLWCGWTCPQTVLMEMVFRRIEYWIDGDSHQQRALARAPWGRDKILRRVTKHAIFLAVSFLIGNTLLAYIIGSDDLLRIITDPPAEHVKGLTFMILFTLLFYGIFARFREQACTFICPYGRFQSALLDENSIVVAYDHKRGERRAPLRGEFARPAVRRDAAVGDCIDCRQCVTVCPTGIDIRNGTQMECVNCTACIDACDSIMDKVSRPRGLIRYASLNGIESGQRLRFTPRLAGYTVVLLALTGVFLFLLFTRSDVQTTLLRAPGALYLPMPDGRISNLYIAKVANKTRHEVPVELRLDDIPGELKVMGQTLRVPAEQITDVSVLIQLEPGVLQPGNTPIRVSVYVDGHRIETLRTVFVGPQTLPAPTPANP